MDWKRIQNKAGLLMVWISGDGLVRIYIPFQLEKSLTSRIPWRFVTFRAIDCFIL